MREGFTLVELLIVLAIIGALMSIGIPIYTNALESARAVTIATNIRVIADSARLDIMMNGRPTADEIDANTHEYDISDYVKLDNYDDYKLVINDKGNSTYEVIVTYVGDAAGADLVLDKLTGCATEDKDNDGKPYCAIDVVAIF